MISRPSARTAIGTSIQVPPSEFVTIFPLPYTTANKRLVAIDAIQQADPPVSLSKPAVVLLCLKTLACAKGEVPRFDRNHPRLSSQTPL